MTDCFRGISVVSRYVVSKYVAGEDKSLLEADHKVCCANLV